MAAPVAAPVVDNFLPFDPPFHDGPALEARLAAPRPDGWVPAFILAGDHGNYNGGALPYEVPLDSTHGRLDTALSLSQLHAVKTSRLRARPLHIGMFTALGGHTQRNHVLVAIEKRASMHERFDKLADGGTQAVSEDDQKMNRGIFIGLKAEEVYAGSDKNRYEYVDAAKMALDPDSQARLRMGLGGKVERETPASAATVASLSGQSLFFAARIMALVVRHIYSNLLNQACKLPIKPGKESTLRLRDCLHAQLIPETFDVGADEAIKHAICTVRIGYTYCDLAGVKHDVVETLQPYQVILVSEAVASMVSHVVHECGRGVGPMPLPRGTLLLSGDEGHGTLDGCIAEVVSAGAQPLLLEVLSARSFNTGYVHVLDALVAMVTTNVLEPAGIPRAGLSSELVRYEMRRTLMQYCANFEPELVDSHLLPGNALAVAPAAVRDGFMMPLDILDTLAGKPGMPVNWPARVQQRITALAGAAAVPLSVPAAFPMAAYVQHDEYGTLKCLGDGHTINLPMRLLKEVMEAHATHSIGDLVSMMHYGRRMRPLSGVATAPAGEGAPRELGPLFMSGSGAISRVHASMKQATLPTLELAAGQGAHPYVGALDASVHALLGASLIAISPRLQAVREEARGYALRALVADDGDNSMLRRINLPEATRLDLVLQRTGCAFNVLCPITQPGTTVQVGKVYYPRVGGRAVYRVAANATAVMSLFTFESEAEAPAPWDAASAPTLVVVPATSHQPAPFVPHALRVPGVDGGGQPRSRVVSTADAFLRGSFTNNSAEAVWVKFGLRFGLEAGSVALQVEEVREERVRAGRNIRCVFVPGRRMWLLRPEAPTAAVDALAGAGGGSGGGPSGGSGGGGGASSGSGSGGGGSGSGASISAAQEQAAALVLAGLGEAEDVALGQMAVPLLAIMINPDDEDEASAGAGPPAAKRSRR